jgi:uncharacterized membrane protein YcaP (DUF421 family)
MNYQFVWKALLMVSVGFFLLRVAGRKSVSQLSIPTTVVMISIGSIIIQPFVEKGLWKTIGAAILFVVVLLIVEYLELRFDWAEHLFTGKSVVVVKDGQIVPEAMRRTRFTVDKLEVRLRQLGISKLTDVRTATLEPNGQLGFELMDHAKPLTVGEFKKWMNIVIDREEPSEAIGHNLFNEVRQGRHSEAVPKHLQ